MSQVKSSDIPSTPAKSLPAVPGGASSLFDKGFRVLNKLANVAVGVQTANAVLNEDEASKISGKSPEDITTSDRIDSGITQFFYGMNPVTLLDLFQDKDSRLAQGQRQKLIGRFPAIGQIIGEFFLRKPFERMRKDTSKPTEENVLSLAERIIKEEEGFESDPYPDGNGYAVGYGFNFGKENVLPPKSTEGLISTNERTAGMRFDEKYFYRGDEGKSRALTKLRKIIKERYDKLSANSVFSNLAGEGSAVRKAVMLSLAYQVGTDGVLNKNTGYVRMLEAISKGDFDTAAKEILDSKAYTQSPKRQTSASQMMKSGILLDKYPESASTGNIAFSRQRLIVGDYTGVKQNPELTLALSDLRDNAVATVQKMNDKNKKDAIRDIEIQKIAYEKSVELAVKKSLDSEMRIRTAEGLNGGGGMNGATIPFINNVVDNTQIQNTNQSVLLKTEVANRSNSFLMHLT